MRKKAERRIRQAVQEIGSRKHHRIDKVRHFAGLHPKVYDKTILDMERVGTIRLSSDGLYDLSDDEIQGLIRRGPEIYVTFAFVDEPVPETEPVVLIFPNLGPDEWEEFERLCRIREDKTAFGKIEEMIRNYINQIG